VHCRRCVVRNNFLTRCPENGILADYTEDCRILYNSIHEPASRLRRLIRVVHDSRGLVVAGNLLDGPPLRVETRTPFQALGNVAGDLTALLADPAAGDLHLRQRAGNVVDAGPALPDVAEDIDGQRRGARPDVGADEWPAED
jgi:hypothetical protein